MSELVAQALASVGIPVQHIPRDHRAAQAATSVQPTGKKLGPLVPEFKCVITVISHVPIPRLQSDKLSSACQLPQLAQSSGESTIPSGARVLRRFQARGVTASQDPLEKVEEVDHPDSPNCGNPKFSPNCGNCKFAVVHVDLAGPSLHPLPDSANSFKLRNPQCHQSSSPADCELKHVYKVGIPEFVHEACLRGHPKNYLGYVPDGLRECIESIASKTPSTRGANMAAELRKWVGRARALEVEEMDLKAKIPKHCKAILRKKRLCLFREMLVASGHEDISIVDDVKGGFAISGRIPAGNAFKPKRTSAVMTVGDLRGCASIVRKGIIDSTGPSGDDHLDASTMEATTKELERGWITGPIDAASLRPGAVVTRRFGIWQGSKCRPIDNYRESGVNATASSIDAITVHTADVVAASVGLRMATDTPARGRGGWQMRTWDLHKAYKNLALCPEALEDSYLAVYNLVSQRCELYKQYVLPFGARSSVHAFCRTSLGIWKIIVALFGIHICVYFDDYICMEEIALAKLTEKCVEIIFALLGWETADDKDNVFSYSSKVLGLEIDLRDAKLGYAAMRNTPARTAELRDSISEILAAGFLARKDGER